MELILIIPLLIGFFTSLLMLPKWIAKASRIGLVWENMNRHDKTRVAGSGGITFVSGFIFSILVYIAISTFYFNSSESTIEIFAITTSVLILALIGLADDLMGWRRGGLSKKLRMVLCLFAAIPLIVINSGVSSVGIPLIGTVDIGIIYALIAIPLGIVATSTTFNFLAGYNGLESGQGIIIMSALAASTYYVGKPWLAFVCLLAVTALIPFWIYNKHPAKVFPGDILTYPLGGLIGIVAILGNIERVAIIFFIPYMVEVILKVRGGLAKQSFGRPDKNNNLEMPYDKIYGLEHLAIFVLKRIRKKVKEKEVVWFIHAIQLVFVIAGLIVLRMQ
jgi:UDP-N-acetylglucosamine--dolichyl-phosphate N-acetylglucosaminephosphotransferase